MPMSSFDELGIGPENEAAIEQFSKDHAIPGVSSPAHELWYEEGFLAARRLVESELQKLREESQEREALLLRVLASSGKDRTTLAAAEAEVLRLQKQHTEHMDDCAIAVAADDAGIESLKAEVARLKESWISVEERLPEMDGITYLVYRIEYKTGIKFMDIMTAQSQAAWHNRKRTLASGITHWQPLPKPPLAEGAGQVEGKKL